MGVTTPMDAYLAVVSKREVRRYEERPIPADVLEKILQAGRATGSSKNTQPWRFVVVTDPARKLALSKTMFSPANAAGAAAVVVIAMNPQRKDRFDAGRCAQSMCVAAWALGVGSCVNGWSDDAACRAVLALPDEMAIASILTLGYPAPGQPRPRAGADPEGVLRRVKRLPLSELVHHETYGA
jgi:nitroreductase